jgi:hypothetical protein
MGDNYTFERTDLAELLLRRWYPERPDRETPIIRDWLMARGAAFDRWSFSVRVGVGASADASHLPGVQRNTVFSSKKRIDILAWQGTQPYIIEVKERIGPGTLGQLQTYSHLWQEEHPDEPAPRLQAIGRSSDDDTIRVLNANGVDVFLYPEAVGGDGDAGGGVPPRDGASA